MSRPHKVIPEKRKGNSKVKATTYQEEFKNGKIHWQFNVFLLCPTDKYHSPEKILSEPSRSTIIQMLLQIIVDNYLT